MKTKKKTYEPEKSNLVEIPTHVKNMSHDYQNPRKTKSQIKDERVACLISKLNLTDEEKVNYKKEWLENEDDWFKRILSDQSMTLNKISDLYAYFFLGVERLGKRQRRHVREKITNEYDFKDGKYYKKDFLGKISPFK